LRERYGSDQASMNQAMMELYKTEKINPLGGCLPILVQIPVFIALYWVLLASVEMRTRRGSAGSPTCPSRSLTTSCRC
jgi:YidC/Oxa1 family membrane protein insertase